MAIGKLLAILAVVFFTVAFILFAFASGNAKLVEDFTLLGLTSFAAAHAL